MKGRTRTIQAPDDRDLCVQDVPFNWDASLDVRKLRVGYLKAGFTNTNQTPRTNANDAAALEQLRALGISLVEISLPEHASVDPLLVLYGEANAALADPVRAQPASLIRQDRVARQNSVLFVTAADYLDVNRRRMLLMQQMARVMSSVDAYVVPFDYADYTPNPVATLNTAITNLTGQPCVPLAARAIVMAVSPVGRRPFRDCRRVIRCLGPTAVAKTGGASLTANHRAAEAFLISAGQLVTSVKPDWFCTVTRTAKRLPSGVMSYGGEY